MSEEAPKLRPQPELSPAFSSLVDLCVALRQVGVNVIVSQDESGRYHIYLKEIGGSLGTYDLSILDADTNLGDLLRRSPAWRVEQNLQGRIHSNLEQISKRLPLNVVWSRNGEFVSIKVVPRPESELEVSFFVSSVSVY